MFPSVELQNDILVLSFVSTAPVMSYAQLEALINKWSSELEDQERHFLQQATQVNAWDRMLVENGEKVETYTVFSYCIHHLCTGTVTATSNDYMTNNETRAFSELVKQSHNTHAGNQSKLFNPTEIKKFKNVSFSKDPV